MRWALIIMAMLVVCACDQRERREPRHNGREVEQESEPTPASAEREIEPALDSPAAPEAPSLDVDFDEALVWPGGGTHLERVSALQNASSRLFRPIGHTSIAFRVRDDEGAYFAYRPRTRRHRRGHLAEVAAYALGHALAIDNVVPTTLRFEARRRMSERLDPRFDDADTWDALDEEIFYRSGADTPGAATLWVEDLSDSDLDVSAAEWGAWLVDAEIPEEQMAIARDLSNMRVLDYLIGNWDRFSGGNMKLFAGGTRVALRDHNVAFGRLAEGRAEELRRAVQHTRRFSHKTVARLNAFDREVLQTHLQRLNQAGDLQRLGLPVLSEREEADLFERLEVVRSHIGAMVAEHGWDEVLYFE